MLLIRVDVPKRPVSNGNSGWFKFSKFRVINPKHPVRIIIQKDWNLFFSENIIISIVIINII